MVAGAGGTETDMVGLDVADSRGRANHVNLLTSWPGNDTINRIAMFFRNFF